MTPIAESEFESLFAAYRAAGRSVPELSRGYARSICRRIQFLAAQAEFLGGINWRVYWDAGTHDHESGSAKCVSVLIKHHSGANRLEMRISCRDTALNLLYKALDDIVCGAVNVCDTIGRLLNLLHELGIKEQRASLGMCRNVLRDDCNLAKMLDGSPEFAQLILLRPIRGMLQHSVFESVLRRPECDAGEREVEPVIHSDINLGLWSGERKVSRFSERVVVSTSTLVRDISKVLSGDPTGALRCK